jgi:hypothetical protein
MARRLKVFTWSDGFHAFTVAASSRPRALAAWGIERDIFAGGLAREITGGPDYDAALARPGEVIERGLTVDVGEAPRRRSARPAPSRPAPRRSSDAARKRLEALEAELKALEREQAAARRELDAEIGRLTRRRAQLDASHAAARGRLEARLARTRKAAGIA